MLATPSTIDHGVIVTFRLIERSCLQTTVTIMSQLTFLCAFLFKFCQRRVLGCSDWNQFSWWALEATYKVLPRIRFILVPLIKKDQFSKVWLAWNKGDWQWWWFLGRGLVYRATVLGLVPGMAPNASPYFLMALYLDIGFFFLSLPLV